MPIRRSRGARVFCLLGTLLLAACATIPRNPAPPTPFGSAAPIGFPSTVRSVGADRRFYVAHAEEMQQRLRAATGGGPLNVLAISGGGAAGAFGAGALVGLSRRGERPPFAVVTGVSAGALIAPFVFLGPSWDQQLREAVINDRTEHLLRLRSVGIFSSPSVYQGKPLVELVDHYVTDELIKAVAAESAKGRLLLVATTDLDKGETVIWDMGAIAAHGGEAARTLFRDVLVASASIPGIFPPVLIHVESSGTSYDEMHVDGGTTASFFFVPEIAQVLPVNFDLLHGANLYVLINGQLGAPPQTTQEKKVPILMRSFTARERHTSRTTLELSAAFAQRYGVNFRFSEIPSDYPFQGMLKFRATEMQALFDYAAGCAAKGQLWTTPEQVIARAEQAPAPVSSKTVECPLAISSP